MRERIVMLDTLRGLGVLGILAVNLTLTSAPFPEGLAIKGGAFSGSGVSLALWWGLNTFFYSKFISLFSMLFGASSFLVGGDGRDPQRNRFLRRRYAWLAAFGVIHGALIWFGDVLLDYALCGVVIYFVRGWSGRALVWAGALLGLASAVGMAVWSDGMDQGWLPQVYSLGPAPHAADVAGSFVQSFTANLQTWVHDELAISAFTVPFTLPLMMLGLGLFKTGFLTGEARGRVYGLMLGLGAAALAAMGGLYGWKLAPHPPAALMMAGEGVLDVCAPLAALGYISALILMVRGGAGWLSVWLAPVGRMAFSNYIAQSLIITALFYGGRGPGLSGKLDRPALAGIVVAVWVFQIVGSRLWIARFGSGPLEALWRRLTYGGERALAG